MENGETVEKGLQLWNPFENGENQLLTVKFGWKLYKTMKNLKKQWKRWKTVNTEETNVKKEDEQNVNKKLKTGETWWKTGKTVKSGINSARKC